MTDAKMNYLLRSAAPRPWRIDKDNAEGIEIVADNGDLVFIENWGDLPSERGAGFAEQVITQSRANAYLIVELVNLEAQPVSGETQHRTWTDLKAEMDLRDSKCGHSRTRFDLLTGTLCLDCGARYYDSSWHLNKPLATTPTESHGQDSWRSRDTLFLLFLRYVRRLLCTN
jgi:hypothetical protein